MSLAKQVFALSLSLAALGYTVIPAVQAAVKPGPGPLDSQSMIVQVQKKAKGKATCGTYMYWSAKERKCVDARLKKSKGS
ncbi:MAG TPA: hypothetical protein VF226_12960 [Hyphomicrobiaceae bacterium]|jgi:hypothetical protein